MGSFLSFGNEKELFKNLIDFIKSPSEFFEKNKETEESLLDFMTFIIRLSAIIDFLIGLILAKESLIFLIIGLVLTILLARIGAIIGLWIGSAILNFFVKILFKKSDPLAAKRIVVYTSVTSLISAIPIIASFVIFLSIILETIGISKQYKLSLFKSFVISIAPIIIIFLLILGAIIYLIFSGTAGLQEIFEIFEERIFE